MMKGYIRLLCTLIVFSVIFTSFGGFSSNNDTVETIEIVRDKKVLCDATLEQDFDDNCVLVIMDNVTGGINKKHDLSFFGDIGATSVTDLTVLSNEILVASDIMVNEVASKEVSDDTRINTNIVPWFEVNEETFRQILKIELSVCSKENVLRVIKELEKIEGIKYAGPNYRIKLDSEMLETDNTLLDLTRTQWAFREGNSNIIGAWNITTGTHNVKVGVIDTGIVDHPDLQNNIVAGVNYSEYPGMDDPDGHGTEIAGIIGADYDNGMVINGICQNVSIVPLKVLAYNEKGETCTNVDATIKAIQYATNNGIQILNYSSGDYYQLTALAQAIINYPGLFVTSAGNDYSNNDTRPHYPSNYSAVLTNIISVAASGNNDTEWYESSESGSNFGAKTVDLYAPGVNIDTTTIYTEDRPKWYITYSGTSYAAPHVAGAAALIMSVRPDMTPEQVKKCIMDSVDKSDVFEGKCVSGGRLNVYKAVQLATQPQTFTGDVNGDGRADMIVTRRQTNGNRAIDTYFAQSNGTFSAPVTQNFSQTYNYQDPVFLGDVNGDTKPDLIVHSTVSGKRSMIVYCGNYEEYNINNYQIPFANARQSTTNDAHNYFTARTKFFVADANGDGRDDFIVHTRNSSGKRINLTYLGLSTGSFSTTASTFTSTNNHGTSPVLIGDFNGDGMADMVVPHKNSSDKRCLLVYKGKSSAPYFAAGVKFNSSRNHDPLQWPCQYFVNDVNGDGKNDLIVHWKNASGKRNNLVYKGGSSGLTTEAVATAATSNDYIPGDPIFVGDINGDGYGDMLVQWANTYNQRNLLVYKGTSSATYGTGTNYNMSDTLDLTVRPSCFFLADATGDGRMDFIVKYKSGSVVAFITYAGTSTGSFSAGAYSNIYSEPPYFNN